MLQEFINANSGRTNVGDTDANRGECVGLVEVWLDTIGAPHIWGNACDLATNADRRAYVVTANTPEYVPAPGDIGVLPAGWGGSSVGHTFIVAPGTDVHTLKVFEQNDCIGGGNGACRIFNGIGWPEGLVFIHPIVLDPAPAPVVAAPAPQDPLPTPVPPPVVVPVSAPDTTPAVPVVVTTIPADTPSEPVPAVPESSQPGDQTSSPQSNSSEPPIVTGVNGVISVVSKYMSRKFLLTVLGVVIAVLGYVSGALSAGESLTSLTFLIGLFNVIEGLIDHKNAPRG